MWTAERAAAALLLPLLLSSGCAAVQPERPEDLTPAERQRKIQVLEVRAKAAEEQLADTADKARDAEAAADRAAEVAAERERERKTAQAAVEETARRQAEVEMQLTEQRAEADALAEQARRAADEDAARLRREADEARAEVVQISDAYDQLAAEREEQLQAQERAEAAEREAALLATHQRETADDLTAAESQAKDNRDSECRNFRQVVLSDGLVRRGDFVCGVDKNG